MTHIIGTAGHDTGAGAGSDVLTGGGNTVTVLNTNANDAAFLSHIVW